MSIKNLFNSHEKFVSGNPEKTSDEVESKDFIVSKNKQTNEYLPNVDLSDPKNFAHFGLAEEYYDTAFSHIANTFPYDGSEKEVINWNNNLTYLEKYLFNNQYPKTSGFITLNTDSYSSFTTITGSGLKILSSSASQFVKSLSGPNTSSFSYKNGNIYDVAKDRISNFAVTPVSGNTVELWFKLNSNLSASVLSGTFALFDLWNSSTVTSSTDYTRFFIDVTPTTGKLAVTYKVGTTGVQRAEFTYSSSELTTWHHYAVSVQNTGSSLEVKMYIDGALLSSSVTGTSCTEANNRGSVVNIGAYRYTPQEGQSAFEAIRNLGAVPGSIDEFRFWKNVKTQKDIARYRFDRIYGGTNTDDANTDLGVYYRFNEGILDTSSVDLKDAVVLDSAGRSTNGAIINYALGVRSTGSAIDQTSNFDHSEPKDPIIYAQNPSVLAKMLELRTSGSAWDEENSNSIYRSLPEWITTEDTEIATEQLKKLTQIIASYFDKLYLQIKGLPNLKFAEYIEGDGKAVPFANSILDSDGIGSPDIFVDAKILEELKDRDEDRNYEEKLGNLKNLIYKNIYNNLSYIYKTKGTEKSFRNLIRSFGIDEELVKLNIYANNTQFALENNKKSITTRKKVINLSTPETYYSNIFNSTTSPDGSSSYSLVQATIGAALSPVPYYLVPHTFETEIYFPKKVEFGDPSYSVPEETSISLFGAYAAVNPSDLTDYTSDIAPSSYNFEAYLVKNHKDDRGGYFKFNCITTGEELTSSYYSDIYEGEKWNFAVRLKSPYENLDGLLNNATVFSTTPTSGSFNIEFYAVNTVEGVIKNELILTSSALTISQVQTIAGNGKRFYVGARRTNFTGSLLNNTDILVSNARFWLDYLDNDEIKEHAKDSTNFGLKNPLAKPYQNLGDKVERKNLLVFNWDFDEVTGSNSSGYVDIKDNKGAVESVSNNFQYNINRLYPARVGNTTADNNNIVKKHYQLSSRQVLPENLYSSDTVNITGESDYAFTKESRPVSLFWSFEKSMYQTISEEILNMFAGIIDFNNTIGDPVNRYRDEYRDLNALRSKFFNKVQNTPSLELYVDYYKWIDSSLGTMLQQLVPAGSAFSDGLKTMVEDHAASRSKYAWNLPMVKKQEIKYGQIKGIKELKYNWKTGHAPEDLTSFNEASSSLWFKERAEREGSAVIVSAGPAADSNKQTILNSALNDTNKPRYKLYDTRTSAIYDRTAYYDRRLARVVDISSSKPVNPSDNIELYSTKNIMNTTSSVTELRPFLSGSSDSRESLYTQPQANYSKGYNVVQAHGRETNNKYFVEVEGVLPVSASSALVSGMVDYRLADRPRNETVIANRFSSPGGPESLSRGAMDRESESFSVYNTVNYRNLIVRKSLKTWLAESSSNEATYPSLHKVNKNHLRSALRDVYDNSFVSHQIPRKETGYAWIANSVTSSITGSGPYSSMYPNLDIGVLPFLTSSISDSRLINFSRINNSTVTASYDTASLLTSFTSGSDYDLHTYLLNQNGPFSHPSWKQTRNTDNALVRLMRNNNKFITQTTKLNRVFRAVPNNTPNKLGIGQGVRLPSHIEAVTVTTPYIEPPVQWNVPMVIGVSLESSLGAIKGKVSTTIKTDYSNNIDNIANNDFRKEINPPETDREELAYSKMRNLMNSTIDDPDEPKLVNLTFSQVVFPRKEKQGLGIIRNRPDYAEVAGTGSNGYDRNIATIRSFWKSDIRNRVRTNSGGSVTGSINSLNMAYVTGTTSVISFSGTFLDITQYWNPTGSIVYSASIAQSNPTLWPLDSIQENYAFSGSSTSASLIYSSSYFGELAPYKTYEKVLLNLQPSGQYSSQTLKDFIGSNTTIYKFTYNNNSFRIAPRPQFVFCDSPYASGRFTATINHIDALPYKTDLLSNNKPWFNSYEDFSTDIRPVSNGFTLIPEFRISNFMDYYIKENNGDFQNLTPAQYLTLDGGSFDENSLLNGFNSTDNFNKFIFKDFSTNKVNKVKVKVNIIKKLLPYKGFYPQERSVQVVDSFRSSFFDLTPEQILTGTFTTSPSTVSGATPLDQQIATIIQPYFAPGVLFNSLKAGLALHFPILITGSLTSSNNEYSSSISGDVPSYFLCANNTRKLLDTTMIQPNIDIGSSTNLPLFNYNFPFESMLSINDSIPAEFKNSNSNNKLWLTNYRYMAADVISGSQREQIRFPNFSLLDNTSDINKDWTEKNSIYRLSINNFISEIPDFFLRGGTLNNFISKPQKDFQSVISGTTYYMDVFLDKDKDYKNFLILDPTSSNTEASNNHTNDLFLYSPLMHSIGEGVSTRINASAEESLFAPPYSLGKSKVRLSYQASITGLISLTEILDNIRQDNIHPLYYYNSNYNKYYMPLSASINLFQKTNLNNVTYNEFGAPITVNQQSDSSLDVWSIQTKFESPVLNFNTSLNQDILTSSMTELSAAAGSSAIGRYQNVIGLWSGYGSIPAKNKGVVFGIEESFNKRGALSGTGSLIELCGFEAGVKDIGAIASTKEISEAIVMIPYVEKGYENLLDNDKAKNILGIPGEEGVTQSNRRNGPFYFNIDKNSIDKLLNSQFDFASVDQIKKLIRRPNLDKNNSIVRCIKSMTEYNIPPHLDWVTNKNIDPFVMYVIEFKHELDQQDLSDIWQGVMPKIARNAQLDSQEFEHPLAENEFFHGKELPEGIRFKMFKVKKKAKMSYYDLTDDSSDDTRFRFDFANQKTTPDYSYNWPYDFFSLVEMVKVEVAAKIGDDFNDVPAGDQSLKLTKG